ncbi:MAG TPA: PfkB family carbohydrate kinase [Kofleriaceae bacterium]|nr:PfkB family carbohydrate kinase [Kofleriaceae bacterium]
MRSANRSLLVVGSVAVDDIDGPFGMQKDLLGGSASFISVAASYFTDKVSLVAVVGDDFDQDHLAYFSSRGIDGSGVERRAGKTFRWVGRYSDDLSSRETLDTQLGVFAEFRPRLGDQHRKADLVFLGNIDPVLQHEVVEQVGRPILIAADTMNFWISGHRAALLATLAKVDTLVINDEEARQLAGEHALVRAAAAIQRMGPHSVVIKRGDSGALLFHEDGVFAAPALPLEDVRDPTGAGDSFAGGFMGYLAYAGRFDPVTVRSAMIYGSVMASFSVEQFSLDGLRNLTPAMIQQRFDAFHALSRFDRIVL